MNARSQAAVKSSRAVPTPSLPVRGGVLQRKCACGGTPGPTGGCAECRRKRGGPQRLITGQASHSDETAVMNKSSLSVAQAQGAVLRSKTDHDFGHSFGRTPVYRALSGQSDSKNDVQEEEELAGIVVVGQTTPDGNTLGPTDPSSRTCLAPNRLIWVGGPGQNTATAATGRSRVTARLGSTPAGGADCDCNCGLFRQYIRGFWRVGSSRAAKRHNIGSCGNTITISENAWTEEFEGCNPGGAPISANCSRIYLDAPGFSAGLSDGTFAQVHFDLRYQMWDQCRGRPVATGDRSLRISGDRHPRSITFS